MRLPDPSRSRVLLIGASKFSDRTLPELPSVANNISDLAKLFTSEASFNLPAEFCTAVLDESSPHVLGKYLQSLANDAEDLMLVYYSGHGLIGQDGDLYLSLPQTDTDRQLVTLSALPFNWLKKTMATARAANRILILDCCFSGLAIDAMGDSGSIALEQVEISGTCTLASSAANRSAIAPLGERNTAYTGEFLDFLRTGSNAAPELLTLSAIHEHLVQVLPARNYPRPEQRNTHTVAQLALARNRGFGANHHRDSDPVADEYDSLSPIIASMTFRIERSAARHVEYLQNELSRGMRNLDEHSALDNLAIIVDELVDDYEPPKARRLNTLTFSHIYSNTLEKRWEGGTSSRESLHMCVSALIAAEIENGGQSRLSRIQSYKLAEIYEAIALPFQALSLPRHAAQAWGSAADIHRKAEDRNSEERCKLWKARAITMSRPPQRRLAGYLADMLCGYGYRPFRLFTWMFLQYCIFTICIYAASELPISTVASMAFTNYLSPLDPSDTSDVGGVAQLLLGMESLSGTIILIVLAGLLGRRWFS
ncbi:caspase family protein [Nocardia sp. NBC_00565]|uniref:caspase family protein n=1 Tax=Nocardia sp. NBC_00565 TaxID=2975993 RepID=UPI002E8075CD|nr:caspase family protein [Nocardia sp. NBC_00565]WUC04145.1 caspase family protein [Nocardia sp. NBC_00565]